MTTAKNFDIKKFNDDFEKQQTEEDSISESDIMKDNKYKPKEEPKTSEKKLYDFTLHDLGQKYYKSMLEIVDILVNTDYKTMNGYKKLFEKLFIDKYLLYIGLTLIVLAILGFLLSN
jgi:hypothetical protein